MAPGLFSMNCPQCGGELAHDPLGSSTCAPCERSYLTRFGHLIPIDFHKDEAESAVPVRLG